MMQTQHRIIVRSLSLRTNRHPKQLRIHLFRRILAGAPIRRHQAKRLRRRGTTVRLSVSVIRHEIEYIVAERSHLLQFLRQQNVLLSQPLVLVEQLRRQNRG